MKFQGTKKYIATEDLKLAVNASLTLEKPLLIKGEPGTGKTMLALEEFLLSFYNVRYAFSVLPSPPTCLNLRRLA